MLRRPRPWVERKELGPDAGDAVIPRKIRYLWEMADALVQPVGLCVPRGVRKYRSIVDANRDRDAWETERVQRLQRERRRL